ncbi:uroporphyrinogen III methyltransferase/synthase [Natranaerovirga hydrolytica]|uniref:uroporphyrinogen-III C-methyltransferase n=1 Tax=Natranaerovirga hydrolytica TaxID=680378 RepID=A0A4R1MPP2_9FIRM|nr:uroporphyrinogen-III C-methyltransferase [Natranaerovirga hydrolytica]TCK92469.1 uroporphyrinogen III methyltransferase/synthase [Natranaerovirga hydrolytica]
MGKVYLVGAGPGDEGLITVKGLEKLKEADVIVYDNLANPDLLKQCKPTSELIYVGKKANDHTMSQEAINDLLVEKATDNACVLRLKGGDPYVFGRGGEEGEYLYHHHIPFEVIPGITSAIGGLAYGGIPITYRELASSFHVFTGHFKDATKELDWATLSKLSGTLVFLMGVGNLEKICSHLIQYGKDKNTPVAMVHKATTPNQKAIVGNLETITDIAKAEKIKSPSLIVVGDVVKMRAYLNTFEEKPLFGKKIIVTRARAHNSDLAKKLKELGAEVFEMPTIKINPIQEESLLEEIKNIKTYTQLIFTSENAVRIFFETLFHNKLDARILGALTITSIGTKTTHTLKNYGIIPDIMPEDYVGEGIVQILRETLTDKDNILIPRSKNARSYLVDELSKQCALKEVPIYETLKEEMPSNHLLNLLDDVDYITFTSGSTVKNFIEIIGKEHIKKLKDVKLISIGPMTSQKIKSYHLEVYKEANPHNIEGLIEALL